MAAETVDLGELLLQGNEMLERSTAAHAERWGLGTAERWSLDQDEGVLRWWFADHEASAPAQVLGSWSSTVGTYVWSWDNATIAEPLTATARDVRAFGEEHEVVALRSSPLRLGLDQVGDMVSLAFRIARATGFYQHYDGATALFFLFGEVTLSAADGSTDVFRVEVR